MSSRKIFGNALLALALVIVGGIPSQAAQAPEWLFDAAHSSIGFSIQHIMSQVTGTFDKFSGQARFDPANLAGSHVAIEIPVSSINTRNAQRDGHLQSPDFFDAAQFPTMKFVGDTFVRMGENRYSVIGRLTIRGVTRRAALSFAYKGTVDHPMKPDHVVTGTRLETVIRRSDFGVGTGSWAATAVVGDEVTITIDIEAMRPKTATSRSASAPTTRATSGLAR